MVFSRKKVKIYISGVVYRIAYKDYSKFYIGKSARAFADGLKEHSYNSRTAIKTSTVAEHRALTGHKTEFDNTTILDKGVKNTHCRRTKDLFLTTKNYNQSLTKMTAIVLFSIVLFYFRALPSANNMI